MLSLDNLIDLHTRRTGAGFFALNPANFSADEKSELLEKILAYLLFMIGSSSL